MSKRRIFWGLFFIVGAVFLIVSKIGLRRRGFPGFQKAFLITIKIAKTIEIKL